VVGLVGEHRPRRIGYPDCRIRRTPRIAMPSPSFVHLRLHSEFSVADGIVRLDDAVARAAADGMGALALTDLGNVFGMVDFYKAARKHGVKPIVGCDVWISNEGERDKPHRLLLLVRSARGYRTLSELLTRAYRENQHRGRAELRKGWFGGAGADGLIALSGATLGDLGAALVQGNLPAAERLALDWAVAFGGAYYVEKGWGQKKLTKLKYFWVISLR
jgi:DNA polymerase-3 subunit alpha